MYTALQVIWVIVGTLIVFFVLLHSPKGDGLGGLGGQAQLFSSTKSAEKTLNQITWFLLTAFLGIAIVLSAGWIKPKPITPPTPSPAAISNPAVPETLSPGVVAPAPIVTPPSPTAPPIATPEAVPSPSAN